MTLIALQDSLCSFYEDEKYLIELFLQNKGSNSQTTYLAYKNEVGKFLQYMNNLQLKLIKYQHLFEYLNQYKNLSPATKAKKASIIRSLFKFLFDLGYIKVNPAALIKIPKVNVLSEHRYLTKEEVKVLLELSKNNSRDYLIIFMLLYTGLRVSELVNIKLEDFFIDPYGNRGLKIVGKGNKIRFLKLSDKLWEAISNYKNTKSRANTKYLLCSKKGDGITSRQVNRIIKSYCNKAGIREISTHWFRHTSATLALMGGADIQLIKNSLGHSSINTTQRYVHSLKELQYSIGDFIYIN